MRPLLGNPVEGSWLCRMDPWKGLEVLWDAADTPSNVPSRVSPWEVLPGTLLRAMPASYE